jgi:hypothetical protein
MLIEPYSTSDRVGEKDRNIVRRQRNFGQSWRKRQQHCQKAGQLRTELAKKTATLSEDKGTSDRVGRKNSNIVRRQRNFGQSWRKRQQHCQKTKELRTELAEKTATLSEGKGTSDRVGEKDSNIVRRQRNFGQSWQKKQQHCQKAKELRTELAKKTVTLSEDKGTSDRVGRKNSNIVRR